MSKINWLSSKVLVVLAAATVMTGCGSSSNNNPPPPPPPPPNEAPTANAGPDQTADEGTAVTLDGSGSTDSDGTIATYTWTQTAGTGVTLDETAPSMPPRCPAEYGSAR